MKQSRQVSVSALAVVALVLAAALGAAEDPKKAEAPPAAASHVMVTAADVQWADGPASLPAGAKAAVIEGDPKSPGLFTMRLKLPADYKVPPHWHPADEHVTVISGTFNMGLGDKLDVTKGKALPMGSFVVMPAKTNHFAFTREETVIQLHGMGPWGITYVNPADDPRKK